MKLASIEAIVRALNDAQVRYLIGGGLAVNAHGYLRFTKDADLAIDLVPDNVLRAVDALEALGYRPALPVDAHDFADPDTRRFWIDEKNMQVFQLWSDHHPETPIDIFAELPFPFDDEYRRALHKPLYGTLDVPFVSLDTLIRMKEAAGRQQNRIDLEHLRLRQDDHEQKNHSGDKTRQWETATWQGARREQIRRWAAMPLENVLAAQEEMHELAYALGCAPHPREWE